MIKEILQDEAFTGKNDKYSNAAISLDAGLSNMGGALKKLDPKVYKKYDALRIQMKKLIDDFESTSNDI